MVVPGWGQSGGQALAESSQHLELCEGAERAPLVPSCRMFGDEGSGTSHHGGIVNPGNVLHTRAYTRTH